MGISRMRWLTASIFVWAVMMTASCGSEGGELAITGLEPTSSPLIGEQPVKISGQNFRTDIGYTVYFGTAKATSVTILDSETLLATTPRVAEGGPVDITISADDGAAFRIIQEFSFQEPQKAGDANKKGNLQL